MVRESHEKFMGKYPYFLDKNRGSNFFRTSDVNNRSVQRLYNELFKLYESFHISKRLFVWREQTKDYDYKINFEANYPNIREVSIYKDTDLIYYEEFPLEIKDGEITKSTDHFHYTYECNHTRKIIQKIEIYQCTECGEIYYIRENTRLPNCTNCNNNSYVRLEAYECNECGEIYYTNENNNITDCTRNHHNNTLEKTDTYKCFQCGTIYHTNTILDTCTYCYSDDTMDLMNYYISVNRPELLFEKTVIKVTVTDNTHTKTVTLNHDNNWNSTTGQLPYTNREYIISDYSSNYDIPSDTLITITPVDKAHTSNDNILTPPIYYDDTIIITDNTVLNDKEYVESLQHKYLITTNTDYTPDEITVKVYDEYDNIVDTVTLNTLNNYTNETSALDSLTVFDTIADYQFDYDKESYDLTITKIPVYTSILDEELDDNREPLEIPIIPLNQFRFDVLTYDEYYLSKGYPERDNPLTNLKGRVVYDVYDHDYSLDEIGALNNIPRKKYNPPTDHLLYPSTEPPYNNMESEDDYHYMNRILEYNTRLWTMNPVSLELWKIYGLESELINREKYILKVFDENKHPFDTETELVKCWTPQPWEHKDRFCEVTNDDYYFFTTASNVRPLIYEPVDFTFTLYNSNGEIVTGQDYYVNIYKIHEDTDWITTKYRTFRDEHQEIIGSALSTEQNDYYELINKKCTKKENGECIDYTLNHITESKIRIPSYVFDTRDNDNDGVTSLLFIAYETNTGSEIGRCDISIKVRDSNDADFYVDQDHLLKNPTLKDYTPDGTRDKPFLRLKDALECVTPNNDLICILSKYVDITEPLMVSESTNIMGETLSVNHMDWIPRLRSAYYDTYKDPDTGDVVSTGRLSRRFFNITGGKGACLTLCNLRLKAGLINNYINIQSWVNNNPDINRYETVITHGGIVKLSLKINYNDDDVTYYPYDYIPFTLTVSKKDDNGLKDMTVNLYYNGVFVKQYTTDENGEISDVFVLDENFTGDYVLTLANQSKTYFESQTTYNIHAYNTPDYAYINEGSGYTWRLTDYDADEDVNYYCNGEFLTTKNTSSNGETSYRYNNIPWGRHILYTTMDNTLMGKVRSECIIETITSMSKLNNKTFIKDLTVDDQHYIIDYETITITNESKLNDLDNIVTDIILDSDGGVLKVEYFKCNNSYRENNYITYSDYNVLKNALTSITYNNDGVISFNRVGDFR